MRFLVGMALLVSVAVGCSSGEGQDGDDGGTSDVEAYEGPSARGAGRYSMALVATEGEVEVADFEAEFDEGTCPADCDGNTPPVLGEPMFVVNGELRTELEATVNDDLVVLVPFEDAECNLACGMQSESHVEPEGGSDGAMSLPSNVPCSTTESKVYMRITPGSYPMDAGDYEYSYWVEDACGGRSENVRIAFNLR